MKGRKLISETGLLLAAILAVAVIIVSDNSFTNVRLDLTENKLFTLSDGTIHILKSLKEPINLDFYLSRKSLTSYPSIINYGNRVRDLLNEYAAESNGKIKLTVIEPEPFSEEEDQAVASGLKGVPINTEGDVAYFGLVGTNSVDDVKVIPFFQTERESSLEYDVTKLIYNLANPKKRVVSVMSSLPIFGSSMPRQQQQKPWAIVNAMREFFTVRNISMQTDKIDNDTDVLMVIHPKNLSNKTLYAIDQYLLGGGKAMFFIDPMAETDRPRPNPQNPMAMPPTSSNLKRLMDTWGIQMKEGKIVGDMNLAMRVQSRGPRGPQEINFLPWLRLESPEFNHSDFATNELNTVNFASAGALVQEKGSTVKFTPLMHTTKDSMLIDSKRMMFGADPASLLNEFVSDNKQWTLAARLSGNIKTAFPEGMPVDAKENKSPSGTNDTKPDSAQIKQGKINAILVADTDLLSDYMWIRNQTFFGLNVPQTLANNGDFVINALDNLSGNNDLISLRTRGDYSRPFTTVEAIRKQAESEFRDREKELQAKLDQTEKRLVELQKDTKGSNLILSPEQTKEIEKFKQDQVKTRKELRNVQHQLRKNIERLGTELKFINIGLVPLLIAFIAIFAGYVRSRRYQ